ncbi:DUF1109 family protein [Acinetobacter sp. B10A]|uniref:NrsF family protein n=1 Tax=Acinetobacter baretiae TaxID=2605383 RepID=UPI001B3C57A9|nr:NrsF family protein [Acinetobacter baretiae]MBF7686564.1 DUF1109 family protein [Acinetobacter baretiae]
MSQHSVHDLIDRLSHDLKPVKPLPHIAWVTTIWGVLLLGIGIFSAYLLNAAPQTWRLPTSLLSIFNWIICITISVWALSHAFLSQIPGYTFRWWFLILSLTLWALINLFGLMTPIQHIEHLGHGTPCYFFVVVTGVPMLIFSMFFLKRYTFFNPISTLKSLSLSTIFLSFSLLSLCHSSQFSLNDFLMHVLGAITLAVLCFGLGSRYLSGKK